MKATIVKVVAWRFLSITITLAILFLLTGDIKSSSKITLFLHTILTFSHYFFESLWNKYLER